MKKTNIDLFIFGNVLKINAQKYKEIILSHVNLSSINIRKYPIAVSISGNQISTDTSISNHCVFNWYDFGYYNKKIFATLKLLIAKASDEAFKVLRSENQLGYIVFADVLNKYGVNALYLTVQGSYKNPAQMNEIINTFWNNFKFLEEDMSLADSISKSLL